MAASYEEERGNKQKQKRRCRIIIKTLSATAGNISIQIYLNCAAEKITERTQGRWSLRQGEKHPTIKGLSWPEAIRCAQLTLAWRLNGSLTAANRRPGHLPSLTSRRSGTSAAVRRQQPRPLHGTNGRSASPLVTSPARNDVTNRVEIVRLEMLLREHDWRCTLL